MSVSLASSPVSAAVSPYLPLNLVTRKRASFHGVDEDVLHVELLIAVTYLNQAATVVLPFVIVDDDLGFEVIFGAQWENWCKSRKGTYHIFSSFLSLTIILSAVSFISGGCSTQRLS